MSELPGGDVTLMLTDIEGSTSLFRRHVDRYPAMLAAHRTLIEGVVEAHSGRIVDREGDAVLAAFATAIDAAAAALEVHLVLSTHPWGDGPVPAVRIGLHTEHITPVSTPAGDRYVSLAVHRVTRVASAGHGHQTLATDATVERLAIRSLDPTSDHRAAVVGRESRGMYRLRGFDELTELHELYHDDEPRRTFPALRAAPVGRPASMAMTTFIGRSEQIEELRALVTANRLVTIVGPGGSGKSRLADEVVAREVADERDVRCVELASVTNASAIPGAIATAAGVQFDDDRPQRDLLVEGLRDADLLLLLDNCEHLQRDVAAAVQAVLAGCERVSIVCTTRVALEVPGERLWLIPPLAGHDAAALFRDRSTAAAADDRVLDEVPAETITSICDRLDGLPLSIELAAGCLRSMSASELAAGLIDRFDLLVSTSSSIPDRHRTLTAVIDWSHALLGEHERTALRRLSVFQAPFDADLAEAAVHGPNGDGSAMPPVHALLRTLVAHSLLSVERRAGRTWYRQHETVRLYGRAKLRTAGEVVATVSAVADHCLATMPIERDIDAAWIRRTGDHLDNLVAITDELVPIDPGRAGALGSLVSRHHWARTDEGRSCEVLLGWAARLPIDSPAVRGLLGDLTLALGNTKRLAEAREWFARYEASCAVTGGEEPRRPVAVLAAYLALVAGEPQRCLELCDAIDPAPLADEGALQFHWVRSVAAFVSGRDALAVASAAIAFGVAVGLGLATAVLVLRRNRIESDAARNGWIAQAASIVDLVDETEELSQSWGRQIDNALWVAMLADELGRRHDAQTLLASSALDIETDGRFDLPDEPIDRLRRRVAAAELAGDLGEPTILDRWEVLHLVRSVLADAIRR